MVDLRGLKEIKNKSAALTEWAKIAYVAEETIMQLSKYITEYNAKRLAAKDLTYRAKYDIEISKLEKHRAEQEMRKAKAINELKNAVKLIVDKLRR
jgi:hypothetical protein